MVGKEVPVPDEDLSGEGAGPPPIPSPDGDTAQGLVRSTASMAVGTALSRVTGFLRVAAMAFALGVAESRLADAYWVRSSVSVSLPTTRASLMASSEEAMFTAPPQE